MRAAPLLAERTDPTSLILRGLADHECKRFERRHMVVRGRRRHVVHDVHLVPWIAGLHLPMPACHQPTGSPALVGDLIAVDDPVTCRRCRRYSPTARTAPATEYGQLALVI